MGVYVPPSKEKLKESIDFMVSFFSISNIELCKCENIKYKAIFNHDYFINIENVKKIIKRIFYYFENECICTNCVLKNDCDILKVVNINEDSFGCSKFKPKYEDTLDLADFWLKGKK